MNTQPKRFLFMSLLVLMMPSTLARASEPFHDDFEDGSVSDNQPVTWSRYPSPFDAGKVEVVGGSLVLTPSTEKDPYPGSPELSEIDLVVTDRLYHNISIETVVRANGPNTFAAAVGALDTFFTNGKQGKTISGLLRPDGTMSIAYASDSDVSSLGQASTNLRMATSDVHLKFDILNDRVAFSAWAEGSQPPTKPQLSRLMPIPIRPLTHEGRAVIASLSESLSPDSISFRYVSVVPEPSIGGLIAFGLLALVKARRRRV